MPSTSHPVFNEIPPCITVTLDELARALDQMGSTEPVSATRLYHTLLLLHSRHPPTTLRASADGPTEGVWSTTATVHPKDQGSQSSEIKPGTEVLSGKEIRRRMLEMVKASFPDGIPPTIGVGSAPRITVTPDNQIGSTEPVSKLTTGPCNTLLQLQSASPMAATPITVQTAQDDLKDLDSPVQISEIKPDTELLSHREI